MYPLKSIILMHVLLVSSNYPDEFHNWGPWNKSANIAISKINNMDAEILAPRPYSIPFKYFPYYENSLIPLKIKDEEGFIHYPRFIYLLPKKIFYPFVGNSYRYFITKYCLKNIEAPDIIHAHHVYPDGYGMLELSRKWKCPLIVDIHGDSFFHDWLNDSLMKPKVQEVIKNCEKIVCVSQNLMKLAIKNGISEEKLAYIPLGVDVDRFKPRNRVRLRDELNIQEKYVILFTGNLVKGKGVKYLLEAVSKIDKGTSKNFKCVIVGEGPLKKELENQCKELKISEHILFTGKVSFEKVHQWYSVADVFVLPSLSEGKPMAINEAMSSGCAIIGTNVSGIPEQVIDGYNGFLVEPKNPLALKEKIEYLFQNEAMLRKMGNNSRNLIIDNNLTLNAYSLKISAIYRQLLNSGPE